MKPVVPARLGAVAVLFCALLPWSAGCRMAKKTANLPAGMAASMVPRARSTAPDPAALQAQVLRYADDFSSRTTAALDEYIHRVETSEARTQGLGWKIGLNSAVLAMATGPNPAANLLDLLALATTTHGLLEERAPAAEPAGALDPWLAASRILETNAWRLAEGVLTSAQQDELRAVIAQAPARDPTAKGSFFERPGEYTALIRSAGAEKEAPGSVFGLVGLDPMSGLDPAVREVTRARLFAERALYAVERMPFLIRWQTELLSERLLRQEEVTTALQSADRLSRAAESVSRTAAGLPDRISAERQAILDALEHQEGRLRELSAEVSRTLAAGEKMSTSLNTTIQTFDALMKRFGVGEPPREPPGATNSAPFKILDYALTAERITAMAQQLDALIKDATGTMDSPALDRRIADLNALSARARADATAVVNRAFLLAAGLILLTFACAAVYRGMRRNL